MSYDRIYAIYSRDNTGSGWANSHTIDTFYFDEHEASGVFQDIQQADPSGYYQLLKIPLDFDHAVPWRKEVTYSALAWNYFRFTAFNWRNASYLHFPGTNNQAGPKKLHIFVSVNNKAYSGSVRLYDRTNRTVLAEIPVAPGSTYPVLLEADIDSLSADPAIWEIQGKPNQYAPNPKARPQLRLHSAEVR